MPELPDRVGILEHRVNKVEEGVANFREFQEEARDFFSRADEPGLTTLGCDTGSNAQGATLTGVTLN